MGRPSGGNLTEHASTPKAVRFPNKLLEQAEDAAGGKKAFPEWLRNVVRTALGIPLDYEAGYAEGHMAGWADSKAKYEAVSQAGIEARRR